MGDAALAGVEEGLTSGRGVESVFLSDTEIVESDHGNVLNEKSLSNNYILS